MPHPRELAPAFETARRLHKKHGKSYYFATQLFRRELRLATYAIYGFLRVPDEIVDNSPQETAADLSAIQRKLEKWQCDWRTAYQRGDSEDDVLRVSAYVFHRYKIPFDTSEHFLGAMTMDLEKTSYENYEDLRQYMYGSAAVVGLMMTHIIGFSDERALPRAEELGYAMQLTNFLRDMDEDYQLRKRVYLPQDELAAFGLSTPDIEARRFSPAFRDFMIWQSQRANALYESANAGISLLHPQGRLAVRAASELYRAILGRIEAQEWDVFRGRAKTSLPEKLKLAARAVKENRKQA
jgi:phytoene synthase